MEKQETLGLKVLSNEADSLRCPDLERCMTITQEVDTSHFPCYDGKYAQCIVYQDRQRGGNEK